MEAPDGSPPQSLCMIRAAEFYPKSQMEKEDPQLSVPLQELAGEFVKYLGRTNDGVLALSNYRISLLNSSTNSETSVPLGLIETVQTRDLFQLLVNCKDASTVKCSFDTAEQSSDWQRRIQLLIGVPSTLESLFAFAFCSWTLDSSVANGGTTAGYGPGGISAAGAGDCHYMDNPAAYNYPSNDERLKRVFHSEDNFMREVERLNFDLHGTWRISNANEDFKLCPSYPRKLLVPCCISDDTLQNVANFRASRRLPAVVWRHRKSGAIIARSSQPEVGWLGWRNSKDEQLLKALADACAFDRGEQLRQSMQTIPTLTKTTSNQQTQTSGENSPNSPDSSHEEVALDEVRKVLIVDARSYTSAVTNRARGGGCECIEYYPCAEIEFMNLGNIHVIRKSFHALRQLCASPPDIPNWLGLLEKTMWLQHLSGLLAASMTVCHAIEKKGRPVLVHCSDGWDRTPQIVATAQLCLDPFYRTVEGFRILVEREWLSYGHKFADRCGHGPGSDELNERCPVFLQWLDLVHQIHKQFPCSFEFSMGYLIKLAQHSLSCLFGTFFCNTLKERIEKSVFERTFSVWPFLSGPIYRNPLYVPNREQVLWPAHNVRDLSLWTEIYLGSLGNQSSVDYPTCSVDGLQEALSPMVKTRSYGDLNIAGLLQNGISRRSSDPNMAVDPNSTTDSNSENNSLADIQSEREDSPDITRKLQNLTIEFNNHDRNEHTKQLKQLQLDDDEDNRLIQNNKRYLNDLNVETLQDFLQQKQQQHQHRQDEYHNEHELSEKQQRLNSQIKNNTENGFSSSGTCFSSPQIDALKEIDCEISTNCCAATYDLPEKTSKDNSTTTTATTTATVQTNGFTQFFNDMSPTINGSDRNRQFNNIDNDDHMTTIDTSVVSGVTIHKTAELHLDLLESVNLGDSGGNFLSSGNGMLHSGQSDSQENMWHGSVNTSTDTLVPIETQKTQSQILASSADENADAKSSLVVDTVDGGGGSESTRTNESESNNSNAVALAWDERKSIAMISNVNSTNCSILPKVHNNNSISNNMANVFGSDNNSGNSHNNSNNINNSNSNSNGLSNNSILSNNIVISKSNNNNINNSNNRNKNYNSSNSNSNSNSSSRSNSNSRLKLHIPTVPLSTTANAITSTLSTSSMPASSVQQTSNCLGNDIRNNSQSDNNTVMPLPPPPPSSSSLPHPLSTVPATTQTTQPITAATKQTTTTTALAEPNLMEESILILPEHQKLEISFSGKCETIPGGAQGVAVSTPSTTATPSSYSYAPFATTAYAQRRRRTSSSNSRPEGFTTKQINGSTISRFSIPGVRSLPMTPPGLPERPQIAISCPDGLAHALSEQNIRLQQIVHEHKLRVDELLREMRDMRMALLKKICPNCNNASAAHDEQCSVLDNVENASICSWEALEDHSGPSSCASSSTQANATSTRWVPDHAVSRCTSCQTEFWLGRRKHHCRSCGQIFCADCSEFTAALPDEKLFSPVRLCGPCYHAVTTRAQVSQLQNSALLQLQQSAAKSAASAVAAAAATAASAAAATSKA